MTAWDAELVVGFLCASGFLLKMGTSNCPNHPSSTAGAGRNVGGQPCSSGRKTLAAGWTNWETAHHGETSEPCRRNECPNFVGQSATLSPVGVLLADWF